MADLSQVGGIDLPLPELPGSGHKEDIYNEFVAVFNSLRRIQSVINNELGLASASSQVLGDLNITDGVSPAKNKIYVQLTEAVAYGQMMSIYPSTPSPAGVAQGRKASNANETMRCWGVCNTVGSHVAGDIVECVFGPALIDSVGGLIPGQEYFLSSTPGAITNVPDPLTETNIRQSIGLALLTGAFYLLPQAPGKLVSLTITP